MNGVKPFSKHNIHIMYDQGTLNGVKIDTHVLLQLRGFAQRENINTMFYPLYFVFDGGCADNLLWSMSNRVSFKLNDKRLSKVRRMIPSHLLPEFNKALENKKNFIKVYKEL